ncbi:MAG: hypothetical protein WBX30_32845, partial [Stellaceae bacterium]
TDPGALDTSGDRDVDEEERGQYRGILVHPRDVSLKKADAHRRSPEWVRQRHVSPLGRGQHSSG